MTHLIEQRASIREQLRELDAQFVVMRAAATAALQAGDAVNADVAMSEQRALESEHQMLVEHYRTLLPIQ